MDALISRSRWSAAPSSLWVGKRFAVIPAAMRANMKAHRMRELASLPSHRA